MDRKYIYFYFNNDRKKPLYVGQTTDIERRFKQHIHDNPLFLLTDKICYCALPKGFNKEQVDVFESVFISLCCPIISTKRGVYFSTDVGVFWAIYTAVAAVEESEGFENFLKEYCVTVEVKDGVIKWESKE